MDEKPSGEAKPKVTRSRARHERRRRLVSARKAAEKYSTDAENNTNVSADASIDSESPANRNDNEAPSKSKARRLRKRNKTSENGKKNAIVDSPSSRVSESVHKTIIEASSTPMLATKIDDESTLARSDIIDLNSLAKKLDVAKSIASEHELLENEKNLKITESSRPIPKSPSERVEAIGDSRELIISKNPSTNFKEEKIVKISESKGRSNALGRVDGSDEASLIDSSKDSCSIEAPKACENSQSKPLIGKMIAQEKTREQVKADREAKKAAKAAAKGKPRIGKTEIIEKTVETKSSSKKIVEENKPSSKKIVEETKSSSKKMVEETKADEVDGEIIAMTTKLVIAESKVKPDLVPIHAEMNVEIKSKSILRAERRAKQEAQRAAKQDQLAEKNNLKPRNPKADKEIVAAPPTSRCKNEDPTRKTLKRVILKENAHEVSLFKHLYHEREQALIRVPTVNSTLHPAIVRLGVQYANKVIVGSNARCVALLAAVKQLIEDFERPPQADFTRGLEASLQESSAYLHYCRPFAVSMQNALRHLKWQMTQLPATTSDEEAKTKLGNAIDTYIQEQIQLADKAISITIQTKISNGDVILTYGFSSLICKILCDAYDAGRKFRVVVVDGRPWLEGREQLRRLAKHGLECSYVLINALSFIMPEVSKVFLGAHAILANGAVMSRVGTAQVALMAKAFNVPVLVACETHKTCERVQTDSIVYNEIADADELAQNLISSSKRTSLINWRAKKSLNLLNLTYDVTPADLVTAVVTELAILPCTSVPVILRIKPSEI